MVCGVAVGWLFGLAVVGGCSLMLPCDGDSPATPVVLPLLLEDEEPTLEDDPALFEALLETDTSSFTPFTPGTDFASFLACFLAVLFGTEPVNATLPLSTLTCTLCRSGFVASCS